MEVDPQKLEALCHESQQRQIVIYSSCFVASGVVVMCLRLYCKARYTRGVTVDDYLAIASLVGGIIGLYFLVEWQRSGLGRHIFCMPPKQAQKSLKWSLAGQIETVIGVALIKVSICLRVLQVLDRVARYLRIFLWILIALIILSHLSETILLLVWCRPLNAAWESGVRGECLSYHQLYLTTYIHVGLDAFTDLICSWIPIFVIVRLKMDVRTKIALCTLMALGSSVAACAIAKLVALPGLWDADFTWYSIAPARWAIAEQFLCVVLTSLPSLWPLFVKANNAMSTKKSARSRPTVDHEVDIPAARPRPKRAPISITPTGFQDEPSYILDEESKVSMVLSDSEGSPAIEGQDIRQETVKRALGDEERQGYDGFQSADINKPLPAPPVSSNAIRVLSRYNVQMEDELRQEQKQPITKPKGVARVVRNKRESNVM